MRLALSRPAAPVAAAWRVHLSLLVLASTAILLLFRRDVADLLTLWWTSTTYGHCLFILPFAIVIEFVEQHDIGPHPLQDGCAVTYLTLIGLQRSEQIASSRTGKADIEGSNPDGAYWGRHRLIRQG